MQRLGLGYEALAHNPGLVYCAISGFGQDGAARPAGLNQIIQGMSGSDEHHRRCDRAPPLRGVSGGRHRRRPDAAMAIAAALAGRPAPGQAPRGRFIDVSMLEAMLATLGWAVSNDLAAGREAQPMGNENMTASPSATFATGDGLAQHRRQQAGAARGAGTRDRPRGSDRRCSLRPGASSVWRTARR